MQQYSSLIIKLLLILSSLILFNEAKATPASDLEQILSGVHSVQADFTQRVFSTKGRLIKQTTGTMIIVRPNKFRWETTNDVIVTNGHIIWYYNKNLKQATMSNQQNKVTGTPAAILSGDAKGFLRNFFTNYKNGWYLLQPKAGAFRYVYLRFDGNLIQSMQLFDKYGQKAVINFSNVTVNQSLNTNLFNFTPPPGTDVIRR